MIKVFAVTVCKDRKMENKISIIERNNQEIYIERKIFVIRCRQVMIDRDLAELYGVETKVLNQAVKRNIERFPQEFCFQLTKEEAEAVASKSQFVTLNIRGNLRGTNIKKLPYAFTEQGIAMLSAVLRSEIAVKISIVIMNAFVRMRHYLLENSGIISRLSATEIKLIEHDKNFEKIFDMLESSHEAAKEGIFFKGQIFDAYAKFESFIAEAEREIILVDNYVDLTVLERFTKKKAGVEITIYTYPKTKITSLDIQKFNEQYPSLTLKFTKKIHDRFLIIDGKTLYHIGASLKDLAKQCFAFEVMDSSWIPEIIHNL